MLPVEVVPELAPNSLGSPQYIFNFVRWLLFRIHLIKTILGQYRHVVSRPRMLSLGQASDFRFNREH